MTKAPNSQMLIEILRRIAHELNDAGSLVGDLHELVELAVVHGAAQDGAFTRSAQSIDILQQRLAGLSHFLSEIAALTPSHWVVESHVATKNLKLTRLAERLNHLGDAPLAHSVDEAGELELL